MTVLAAIARDALSERLGPDTHELSVSDVPDFESFERLRSTLGQYRPTRSLWRATPSDWYSWRVGETYDLLFSVVHGAWYTVANFVNCVAVLEAVVLRDASPHLAVELDLLRHGVPAAEAWRAAGVATGTRPRLPRECLRHRRVGIVRRVWRRSSETLVTLRGQRAGRQVVHDSAEGPSPL